MTIGQYCFYKGQTATSITASPEVSVHGSSVMIQGTVTDQSPATKDDRAVAKYPHGVPCVSEASMSHFMESVYMQKPLPTNTTGVPLTISVVDANGNYREIGTTTSDADGFFTYNWKPDIDGQFTVYANFAGSESYWPSHAVTSFAVDPTAPTPTQTAAPVQSITDQYFIPAVIAIILAIVACFAVTIILLRKRP